MATSTPARAPAVKTTPRPIPSRSQAVSFSIAASEPKMILKYALSNMTPEELHQRLLDSVDKLVPSQIEKLNAAIESTGIVLGRSRNAAKDDASRHCLRCHRAYLERNNGLNACIIPHYYPVVKDSTDKSSPGAATQHLLYPCCGGRSDVGAKANPCFRGRHSTQAVNVNYQPHNVKTCEEAKCVPDMRQA